MQKEIFSLSPSIRYIALYLSGDLSLNQRSDLKSASSSESDKYEELFVNPALLTLATQRGEIDCGGTEFVIVGYGNFLQLIIPLDDGHVSVAFERSENPILYFEKIRALCVEEHAAYTQ